MAARRDREGVAHPDAAEFLKRAVEIRRLHGRVRETFAARSGKAGLAAWQSACAEFHERYHALACPPGWDRLVHGLDAGDDEAIDWALSFVEIRPYFFRSGYMYRDLVRRLKRAPLDDSRRARWDAFHERYRRWRVDEHRRRVLEART
jgi:hypothetical protein